MHDDQLLRRVRELFRASLDTRFTGGAHHHQTRAQGYLDGYMRALIDAGLADSSALLRVIGTERCRDAERGAAESGPAAVDAA
jgi:hypothetical protein